MTPRNLLVNTDNLEIRNGEIMLRDKSLNSLDEINFENYCNEYSWGNNGNSDSRFFNVRRVVATINSGSASH